MTHITRFLVSGSISHFFQLTPTVWKVLMRRCRLNISMNNQGSCFDSLQTTNFENSSWSYKQTTKRPVKQKEKRQKETYRHDWLIIRGWTSQNINVFFHSYFVSHITDNKKFRCHLSCESQIRHWITTTHLTVDTAQMQQKNLKNRTDVE